MQFRPALAALVLVVVSGCSLMRPSSSELGASPQLALEAEQRRLAELFRGTPVAVSMQADGSLRLSVPLRYSFDKGRFAVKPPLGAVLERVAKSQRGAATRLVVAAPADPQSKGLMLATERATSARDYMVIRGVDASRFSVSAAGRGDVVIVVAVEPSAH
ncbi:MAG: hypothetical protein M3Y67_09910 [Pseudomonadota bacterium]|nr:hypothetical protein [Pseudomonadota bacterium]